MLHLIILLFSIQFATANHFEELNVSNGIDKNLAVTSQVTSKTDFAEADKLYEKRGVDISNAKKAIEIYKSKLESANEHNASRYIQLARMEFYIGQFMKLIAKQKACILSIVLPKRPQSGKSFSSGFSCISGFREDGGSNLYRSNLCLYSWFISVGQAERCICYFK